MNNPFRTTNIKPENAELVYSLSLTKNKAAIWAMNGASIPLLFFFGWLFGSYLELIRAGILAEIFTGSFDGILSAIAFIGTFAVLIVVHELVHGAFFWVFTRQRPKFGFRGWYAYAAAPGWFFPRKQYLVVGLAPFVLLSVLGMILLATLPAGGLVLVLFAVIVNATSSIGDLWIVFKLVLERRPVVVEDLGDGMNFYAIP
jgi:hypothetical protein